MDRVKYVPNVDLEPGKIVVRLVPMTYGDLIPRLMLRLRDMQEAKTLADLCGPMGRVQ